MGYIKAHKMNVNLAAGVLCLLIGSNFVLGRSVEKQEGSVEASKLGCPCYLPWCPICSEPLETPKMGCKREGEICAWDLQCCPGFECEGVPLINRQCVRDD